MGEGSLSQEDIDALLNVRNGLWRSDYHGPSFEEIYHAMSNITPLEEDMIGMSHLSQDELDHLFPGEPMPLDILEDENDSDGEPRIEDVIRYAPQYTLTPHGWSTVTGTAVDTPEDIFHRTASGGFWESVLNVGYPPDAISSSGAVYYGRAYTETIDSYSEEAIRNAFESLGLEIPAKKVNRDSRMKCLEDK